MLPQSGSLGEKQKVSEISQITRRMPELLPSPGAERIMHSRVLSWEHSGMRRAMLYGRSVFVKQALTKQALNQRLLNERISRRVLGFVFTAALRFDSVFPISTG